MNYVQAFVNNISFPHTLDQLVELLTVCDYGGVRELDENNNLVTNLLSSVDEGTTWTAPKWCKIGDIVFFMHAKTANQRVSHVASELKRRVDEFSPEEREKILAALELERALYKKFGGKIFAIGKVSGDVIYDSDMAERNLHWHSPIYALIDDIFILQNPVYINEFNSFITIARQSAITPVFGESFNKLKSLIIGKNSVKAYFKNSAAAGVTLRDINQNNWISIASEYRRCFFLEEQFRSFFVNYLLKELGDIKTIYKECACYRDGGPVSYVDNVILFNDKYLPVEVKLNISAEQDLKGQVSKYCHLHELTLSTNKGSKQDADVEKIYNDHVLIVDTNAVYIYTDSKNLIQELFNLDDLKSMDDIKIIAAKICGGLGRGGE